MNASDRSIIRSARRAGMASLLAISLLVLIASILAALGTMAAADARRSRDLQTDAQLRQLLTAGAIQAQEILRHEPVPSQPLAVAMPDALRSAGGKLAITFKADNRHDRVSVNALLGQRSATQAIDFNKSAGATGAWEIESVDLGLK